MNTEILGIVLMFVLVVACAIPFGQYIGKVFGGEKTWFDKIFNPVDTLFYKLSGVNPTREMNWKQHLAALLTINFVWCVLGMFVLMNMSWLPLNPDKNPSMNASLAFNTTISFVCNTNLQHYAGETGISYLGQLVLMLFQFISAGCGMAIAAMVFNAMKPHSQNVSSSSENTQMGRGLGNFYFLLVRSCTRILFPVALIIAVLLVFNGTPMTFEGKDSIANPSVDGEHDTRLSANGDHDGLRHPELVEGQSNLRSMLRQAQHDTRLSADGQGEMVQVSRGPVAAFVPIKHLGTNGGGFFGANASHPFENPNYFTNILEMFAQMLLPIALIFAMGYVLKKRKFSRMVFGVMTIGFMLLLVPTVIGEMGGNPALEKLGIGQTAGNMEGKEMRLGAAASAYWSIATTVISTGSVNSMHDSFMPLSGMNQMLGMMVNAFYGGVGVGFLNFYIFIILAVFISGLMVGRTPEFMGKKIEAKEMKIAMLIALLHPFLILAGTAVASYLYVGNPAMYAGWLNNSGYHGFSEMLYEFTSSSANNGSGFEGLGDNTAFWNIASGMAMLLGRFLPIIGPVAIAGSLAAKRYIPESAGTLQTDTPTFGLMVFVIIAIVAALAFFPALTLGPVAEWFLVG